MLKPESNACVVLIGCLTFFAGFAAADPQPLSSSVLNGSGVQLYTSVNVPAGNPAYPVSFNFGSGGGFTTTIDSTNTVMWCVDAEEDIAPPTTYNADIVEVSKIGSNSSDVRYGSVTSGQWQNSYTVITTTQQRYEMAAYLVSTYPGVSTGTVTGPTQSPSLTLDEQEIQTAIWEIMWNSSVSPQGSITYSDIANGSNGTALFTTSEKSTILSLITQAQTYVENNPNATLFNDYAVVSGGANSNGSLQSPGIQTYLVQLNSPSAVPEPASVVLLGSLLAFVFLLTYRLRRVQRVREACGVQCNAHAV